MTKQFSWDNLGETDAIADGDTFRWYLCKCNDLDDLVEYLNKQDTEIKELKDENQKLKSKLKQYSESLYDLEKRLQEFLEKDWVSEIGKR